MSLICVKAYNNKQVLVPRRLFFATQKRIAITWKPKQYGEMSNFGEIIKKLYFLVWWKARQRATQC